MEGGRKMKGEKVGLGREVRLQRRVEVEDKRAMMVKEGAVWHEERVGNATER